MKKTQMPFFYIGIFLVSLATLVIEISLTRIFSVTMWYHFAFMVISIALFGFGASGAFLTVFKGILRRDPRKVTAFLALSFSITSLAGTLIVSRIPLDPFQIAGSPANILKLLAYYVVIAIPFFLSGMIISFLLSVFPESAGKLYFFNLAGSGAGCLAVIFLISLFSTTGAVVAGAMCILLAVFFFNFNVSKNTTVSTACLLVLCLPLLFSPTALFKFRIADSKALSYELYEAGRKPVLTRWNAFSQLDVIKGIEGFYAPGLSQKYPLRSFPEQVVIYIDADAVAPITRIEKGTYRPEIFKYIPSSMACRLRKNPSVCIIGAGGGFDVLAALSTSEPSGVAAVEINSDILDIVRSDFDDFSGSIYDLPNVTPVVAEGRSFIRNSRRRYDIIQLSLVDTWAAASSGAYTLAENYLYTEEAFADYVNHLSPDGILTVTRWLLDPPKESLRIASLAFSSLEKLGVSNPGNCIVFIRSGRIAVLLLKKTPFSASEIAKILNLSSESGFGILYAPRIPGDNAFHRFIASDDKNLFYESYPFNITPPTDDKPFYFHFFSLKNIDIGKVWRLSSIDRNNISYLILLFLLVQAALLSVIFILGPLAFIKRGVFSQARSGWRFLLYFASLGLGFMFVEVTLIQKFILFLGHPVYSLAVVLSSFLVFAGLGSLCTSRFKVNPARKLKFVLVILAVLLFAYMPFLSRLSYIFLGWRLAARCVVSVLLLAPLGFLMGMPFPVGIRLVSKANSKLLPWVWGVNGCFSVTGSVLSVVLAMSFGFSTVMNCAAVIYLLAIVALTRHNPPSSPVPSQSSS